MVATKRHRRGGHEEEDDDDDAGSVALPSSLSSRSNRWTCNACGCNTNSIINNETCTMCGTAMPSVAVASSAATASKSSTGSSAAAAASKSTNNTRIYNTRLIALGHQAPNYDMQTTSTRTTTTSSVSSSSSSPGGQGQQQQQLTQQMRTRPPQQQPQQQQMRGQQPYPYHQGVATGGQQQRQPRAAAAAAAAVGSGGRSPLRTGQMNVYSDETTTVASELTDDDDFTRPGIVRVGYNPDEEVGTIGIGTILEETRTGGHHNIIGFDEPSIVEAEIAPDINEVVQAALRQRDQEVAQAHVVKPIVVVAPGIGTSSSDAAGAGTNSSNNVDGGTSANRVRRFYLIVLAFVILLFSGGIVAVYFVLRDASDKIQTTGVEENFIVNSGGSSSSGSGSGSNGGSGSFGGDNNNNTRRVLLSKDDLELLNGLNPCDRYNGDYGTSLEIRKICQEYDSLPYIEPNCQQKKKEIVVPKLYWSVSKNKTQSYHQMATSLGNPDFERKHYDDESALEYIMSNCGYDVARAYTCLAPAAFRADLFRFCALYVEGGLYLDSDIVPLVPLRELYSPCSKATIGYDLPGRNQQGKQMKILAGSPGASIFKCMIDSIVDNARYRRYFDHHLAFTGPILLNQCYDRHNENVAITYHDSKAAKYPFAGMRKGNTILAYEIPSKKDFGIDEEDYGYLFREGKVYTEKCSLLNPMIEEGLSVKEDNNSNQNRGVATPRITWLMSFPNSGTSYTLDVVRIVSGESVATNYASETSGGLRKPVVNGQSQGPFWLGRILPAANDSHDRLVLTKTHCGLYSKMSSPSKAIQEYSSFTDECAKDNMEDSVPYDHKIVKKAIHLIRDPFDNIVSRFRLEVKLGRTKFNITDREAFRSSCFEENEKMENMKIMKIFLPKKRRLETVVDIPCSADFLRYVLWHNKAFESTQDMTIETLVVHYDQYESDFNRTISKVTSCLETTQKCSPPTFVSGKSYRNFYTDKEIEGIRSLFRDLASNNTWNELKRYFEDDNDVPVLKLGQQSKFIFPSVEERVRYYLGSLGANHTMDRDTLCQMNLYQSEQPMYNDENGGPWLFNKGILERRAKVENAPYAADTLLQIIPKLRRPETDLMVMHFGDAGRVAYPYPTFAKARPLNHPYGNNTILIPLNVPRHFGKLEEVKANDVPWAEKNHSLIWRGAPTGHGNRITLIQKQTLHPRGIEDVDIGLTSLDDGTGMETFTATDGLLVSKPRMTIKEQLKFKYLLSLEGNDVASGLKWMLYSNSVVFMPPPTVVSWAMENHLVPWYHYIPLEKDLSDLHVKIRWARNHDKICERISQQASKFMDDLWVSDKAKNDTEGILLKIVQRYQESGGSLLSECNGGKSME